MEPLTGLHCKSGLSTILKGTFSTLSMSTTGCPRPDGPPCPSFPYSYLGVLYIAVQSQARVDLQVFDGILESLALEMEHAYVRLAIFVVDNRVAAVIAHVVVVIVCVKSMENL